MTVDLIKQHEALPAEYPYMQSILVKAEIWGRIEAYIAHRFTPREVVWTLSGEGGDQWHPPLTPVVSRVSQYWDRGAWANLTLDDGPLGICLPFDGIFKVTAQVGGGDVPPPVREAYRRLAEYLADDPDISGASSVSRTVGDISTAYQRGQTWQAKALINSGAADLLRPYRRS